MGEVGKVYSRASGKSCIDDRMDYQQVTARHDHQGDSQELRSKGRFIHIGRGCRPWTRLLTEYLAGSSRRSLHTQSENCLAERSLKSLRH